MPKVRRRFVPEAVLRHLAMRVRDREVTAEQLRLFARGLDTEPDVPVGRWFKCFPEIVVCGEGEFVKTILCVGQIAEGEEVR